MKRQKLILCVIFCIGIFFLKAQNNEKDVQMLKNIYNQSLVEGKSYDWLHHICYNIGNRISGSYAEKKMVQFLETELKNLGAKVSLQAVSVPCWSRGLTEYAYIENGKNNITTVPILALGGSVATPPNGIKAQVVEFQSLNDLKNADIDKVVGKIVFLNGKMPNHFIDTFKAYEEVAMQRALGARVAVDKGAVAVIVRSLSQKIDDVPHTGGMSYEDLPKSRHIPAAAISTKSADLLSSLLSLNPSLEFYFKQNCKWLKINELHNVIAEIKGSEFPDEIITIGAHLDSWDVGQGAHDDGAGVVQAMEVIRIFKALNYTPKRTIRVVLFANEENGAEGGKKYALESKKKLENQLFAVEADLGGFTPRGFNFSGNPLKIEKIKSWKNLFTPYHIHLFEEGFSGVDIQFLKSESNVLAGLVVDSQRYFDYHHSASDVFEAVNKRELEMGAATLTSLIYLIDFYGL